MTQTTLNNLNKNSTSKDILAIFKDSTESSITGWQGQLISSIIFMIKSKNTKKSYETLKNIVKDYIVKNVNEEWRRVSSQRTKVLSCAKRIAICYNTDITDLDGEQIWSFLKSKKLTNQKSIEKTIDKEGKLKTETTETTETETTETTETETMETETAELVNQLASLYARFTDKDAFYKAVVALNPSLFGVTIAEQKAA